MKKIKVRTENYYLCDGDGLIYSESELKKFYNESDEKEYAATFDEWLNQCQGHHGNGLFLLDCPVFENQSTERCTLDDVLQELGDLVDMCQDGETDKEKVLYFIEQFFLDYKRVN